MKKGIALLLAVLMMFSLCACGHTHAFGEWETDKAATCTEDGLRHRSCECGEVEEEVVPAAGHTYTEWKTEKDATCTEDGSESRQCSVCGTSETQTIAAKGHSFTAATLFAPKTCTVCGETEGEALATLINVGDEVSAEDHSFVLSDTYFANRVSEKRGNSTHSYGVEGNYLILKLEFTNLKTEKLENNSDRISNVNLEYMNKFSYEGDYRLLIDKEIVPLAKGNLFIYFTIPESMRDDKTSELLASFQIDGTTYAVILQNGDGAEATSEGDEESAAAELASELSIGDTRTDGAKFSFVFEDMYYTTKLSEKKGNTTFSFGSEGHYFVLKLRFTNLTTTPLDNNGDRFSAVQMTLDNKYNYDGDYRILGGEIVPLADGNVYLYFSVPEGMAEMEGEQIASFKLDGNQFTVNCKP